jgi:uncharacterized protein
MADRISMKIKPDRLTATPTPFEFEGDSAWWRASLPAHRDLPSELDEPFRVLLQSHQIGEDIFVEGRVEGALEVECSRCLARYRHTLREPFRVVLEPAGQRQPTDPEAVEALARDGVCLGDDLETGWFRGTEIDLGAISMEAVVLALPVKPLCRDDCAGLCPVCGADRNTNSCGCEEIRTDSPFAALQALRDGRTGGQS